MKGQRKGGRSRNIAAISGREESESPSGGRERGDIFGKKEGCLIWAS